MSTVSPTVYLSRAEARALEEACAGPTLRDLRDRALVVFMLATGVRSSEALGLHVADLSAVDGHAVTWITSKGGSRGRVKIAPRAHRMLQLYLDEASITDGAVFRRLRPRGVDPAAPTAPRAYVVHSALSYVGLIACVTPSLPLPSEVARPFRWCKPPRGTPVPKPPCAMRTTWMTSITIMRSIISIGERKS